MRRLKSSIYGTRTNVARLVRGNEEFATDWSRESWERKFCRMSAGFLPKRELVAIVEEVNKMPLGEERKYKVARDIMFEKAYA